MSFWLRGRIARSRTTDIGRNDFCLTDLVGRSNATLRPVLLYGPAGTGKTFFARRIAEVNHTDIAALTAQAINPRAIAAPVIVHKGSVECRKIVGVLFANDGAALKAGPDEVCDCGGSAALNALTRNVLGLVQVDGQSAEPIALDKQYLIIPESIPADNAGHTLDGKPVIAGDSDGSCFFKRLRLQSDGIAFSRASTVVVSVHRSFFLHAAHQASN